MNADFTQQRYRAIKSCSTDLIDMFSAAVDDFMQATGNSADYRYFEHQVASEFLAFVIFAALKITIPAGPIDHAVQTFLDTVVEDTKSKLNSHEPFQQYAKAWNTDAKKTGN